MASPRDIRVRRASPDELDLSLELLFRSPHTSSARVRQMAEAFKTFAETQELDISRAWLVLRGARPCLACILLPSPGQCGTAMLSPVIPARDRAAMAQALRALLDEARLAGLCMVQAIYEQDCGLDATLTDAGFQSLARLTYMECDVPSATPRKSSPDVAWLTYNADTHAQFAAVIEASYEGSLDCPGLTGVREIEAIIEAHKAAGVFQPKTWLLLLQNGQPAGVLLLNAVAYRLALEVVYMGIIPTFRGQGLGRMLIARAVAEARHRNIETLMLAVDDANTPARRIYESVGFTATTQRDAWIHVLSRADGRLH